ncbi:hypothetical protein ACIO8F_38680 [Streptomyces sp. NPDC087228]|uniref:hypothetical protein n=1 Tax=unclassified Streptomyces TaxID=2593676 RepID=UPI0033F3FD6C
MDASDVTTTAHQVNHRWRARQAPDGDFVVFADGSLSVMNLLCLSGPDEHGSPGTEEWHWTELLRATEWSAGNWVEVDSALSTHTCAGSRAWAGESADHGSIGWVALTRDDGEDTLEWIAISNWSNPFCEVTLDETTVTAASTAGRIWAFPRNVPQNVKITEDPAHPRGAAPDVRRVGA